MALSPNGRTVASGSQDGTVRLWDIETGKVVVKWQEHTDLVKSVCWSPDGKRVVSGSFDETARVWDVSSGKPVQGLNPIGTRHQLRVFAVSYSPKATMIATGGDGTQILAAKTGKLLNTVTIPYDDVWSLTWTSDEKKLISGSRNGLIKIFNTATWQLIATLRGHTNFCFLTLFLNDRLLASTSSDETARLWNLDTNLQIGLSLQHENHVECAAFSTDGKLLSTACDDQNAYVWDIHSILEAVGLEELLTIPDAQKSKKVLSGANASRRPAIRPAPRQVPAGFFDNVQPSSTASPLHSDPSLTRRRRTFALPWESRPRALLAPLPQLFRRSKPNADEPIELQQCPGPSTSSRRSPPVVEVPALDDKKALYVAPPRERAGDKAKHIKNPNWWARVVLFICCVSPSTDDGH